MQKDFGRWQSLKEIIDQKKFPPLFRSREIWWCSVGVNVGVEIDGKNNLFERPVLVFRKLNSQMFLGLPLTSGQKSEKIYYFPINLRGQDRTIIISQLRLLSSKRLIRRIGKLSGGQFEKLNRAFESFIQRTDPAF